jgi:nucleoid-associated protein YgaU
VSINKTRVASELLGPVSGGGELQKLTITYERSGRRKSGEIEALFNPNEITLAKSATWEQQRVASHGGTTSSAVEQEFRFVEAATFDIELFFDTYEPRSGAMSFRSAATSLLPAGLTRASGATDVRWHTDRVAGLVEADRELHRPPRCHLHWGAFDIFTGVLTSVRQRFTLFLEDGTPVRATLSCGFVESGTEAHAKAGELHSSDVAKKRQVRRNDTLQSIAAEEYNDPTLWRPIAKANAIVNPRDLRPGTVLTIPKLRP